MCTVGNFNGTRCRDGVKVLWCHSHLVWLFFLGFHPYMRLFSSKKLFCGLFLLFFWLFFVLLFRNSKREKVGGEVEGKMHGL